MLDFFFQEEDGIRDLVRSRGLGDVYKRQSVNDMTAASLPHDHPIAVGSDQIDFMGHVNNAHYLSWVQEAVLSHWRHIAPPDAVAAHLWLSLIHI